MTEMNKRAVAVIGAGMAGLAAARKLRLAGVQVTVLEKNSHIGGRVNTEDMEGFYVETGAQFMVQFYEHTRRLIQELGLQNDVINISGGAGIKRGGNIYKVWPPEPNFLFKNLVSLRSKLLLIKMLGPILQQWKNLDVYSLYKAYPLDTQSVTEYAHQELDDELLEYLFQPTLSGIVYWTPEHTTQVMIFLLFKFVLNTKIFTLRRGLGQLPKAMATGLVVLCNAEAINVTVNEDNRYNIEANIDGQMKQFNVDGIVCATPATKVSSLFTSLNIKQRAFFDAINYSSTVSDAIGLDRRLPTKLYGIFYPRREVKHLATVSIDSGKDPIQASAGRDMIMLYSSGQASQDLLDKDDAFIQDTLLDDLRQAGFFYDVKDHILFSRVIRTAQAIPEFDVGHFKRLKTFADGDIEFERVVFAGDYIGGPFIEGAITSGIEAAERLLKRLNM